KKAMESLAFSEIQAQAILDLQLRRLSALERQKIIDEYEGIIKLIAELEEILAHEPSLRRVIIEELEEVKKEFGDARRTEITDAGTDYSIEDLIADEEVAITVTKSGYIKRTPVTTYSRQGRGGKGRFGAMAKNDDYVEHLFIASTHAYLMIFTDDGLVYKLKVHEVPDAAASARGKAIVNLIQISSDRKLAGVVPVREFSEGRYVLMVTKKGVIKKTALSDFQNIRSNGIIAINIDEGDELLDVVTTDGSKRIFIATHNGFAIRFDEKNARPMGRATRGTRGIDLRKDDIVVSLCAVSADDSEKMLSVSERGYGKQTPISTYRLQSRGGKGRFGAMAKNDDYVEHLFIASTHAYLMIFTDDGLVYKLKVHEVPDAAASARGKAIVNLIQISSTTLVSWMAVAFVVRSVAVTCRTYLPNGNVLSASSDQ
ncbi:MAG: DNA gyrase subunit A, partial [Acidobacteria bacterium]